METSPFHVRGYMMCILKDRALSIGQRKVALLEKLLPDE